MPIFQRSIDRFSDHRYSTYFRTFSFVSSAPPQIPSVNSKRYGADATACQLLLATTNPKRFALPPIAFHGMATSAGTTPYATTGSLFVLCEDLPHSANCARGAHGPCNGRDARCPSSGRVRRSRPTGAAKMAALHMAATSAAVPVWP